jgi:hypothetical protein
MPTEVKKSAHGPAHYGGYGTRQQRINSAKRSRQRSGHQSQETETYQTGIGGCLDVFVMDKMSRGPV